MDFKNSVIMLTLLVGAIGSGVLLLRNSPDEAEEEQRLRLSIGYYVKDARLSGTGDDGKILYRASAARASQNFDDGLINLEDVHVIYDPATEIPWVLDANTGRIPRNGNIIELEGDVVAQTNDEGEPPMTIRTDYMELYTETYIAETKEKVAIDYTNNRVFATGMRAFLEEDRLQLLSNVNGKFLPQ
jgi:lipopolysaccharide export system protein LptC